MGLSVRATLAGATRVAIGFGIYESILFINAMRAHMSQRIFDLFFAGCARVGALARIRRRAKRILNTLNEVNNDRDVWGKNLVDQ